MGLVVDGAWLCHNAWVAPLASWEPRPHPCSARAGRPASAVPPPRVNTCSGHLRAPAGHAGPEGAHRAVALLGPSRSGVPRGVPLPSQRGPRGVRGGLAALLGPPHWTSRPPWAAEVLAAAALDGGARRRDPGR